MGVIGSFELSRRLQVVLLAKQILDSGAHYLWGAQGDGHVRMHANVVGATPEETYLYAASLREGFVCAGRSHNGAVRRLPEGNTLEQAQQAAANPGARKWARYYRDGDTRNPSPSGLVHGESCIGKLHFDCAGFVRHCFRQALNIPIRRGMQRRTTLVWERAGNRLGIRDVDIYPGDILYGHGHVGLATGKTEYGAPLPDSAIHAYYSKAGVVTTPITSQPLWAEVRRWNDWGSAPTGG